MQIILAVDVSFKSHIVPVWSVCGGVDVVVVHVQLFLSIGDLYGRYVHGVLHVCVFDPLDVACMCIACVCV